MDRHESKGVGIERKFSRRRFLQTTSAVIGAGSLAALAGCVAPAAPTGPAVEAYELRFIKLAMSDVIADYFHDTVIPEFEAANEGATVTVDMSTWGNLGEKLLTSFAGNIPVDLLETGSDWVGPYAKRDQFLSIESYVVNQYQDEIVDFYPDMVELSRYGGDLRGLPYILDIRTLCYRKDHFEEAGLDPEVPPDTWDDLVDFGTRLLQMDDQGNFERAGYLLNAAGPGGAFFEYWYLLVQNGSGVVVPWGSWDPEDVAFNGPEGLEALQFMYDLIHTHAITPMTGMSSQNPSLSPLGAGVASMHNTGAWEIGNWKQNQADNIHLLGVGIPLMKVRRLQYAVPNVYAVGSNTRDADRAWALMEHMVSRETLTGMLGPVSQSPPRMSIAAEAEYMQDPLLKKYQAIPEEGWGTTTPQAVDFPTLELIGQYVQAALRDEMGLQAALDAAAAEVQQKIIEALEA
ncbi:MAG: extracellular solute-binding protein [Caldilineaceae bacterium SB0662_bin_9]|uniref:Extracellular solute-binding protein n=1 Tax=Caldilineaceae bacterium SB0662_bin_9 TaxID=2605258 RepID=A0A6B1DQ05_9CHLR|nr:extracellular solute-binding protein [Caldilineaceae bacterium SB0662_bin_9]